MLTASISKLVPFTHNPTNVLAVHTSVLNALDYGTHIVLIVDLFVSHAVPSSSVPEKIVPLLRTSNFRTFETKRLPLPREIRDFGKIASPLHMHPNIAPSPACSALCTWPCCQANMFWSHHGAKKLASLSCLASPPPAPEKYLANPNWPRKIDDMRWLLSIKAKMCRVWVTKSSVAVIW